MKTFFKVLLLIVIWAFVALACVAGAVLYSNAVVELDDPVSLGLGVFAALFFVWFGVKLIVFLFRRWQAKRRVEKLVNIEAAPGTEKKFSFFQYFERKSIERHIDRVFAMLATNMPASKSRVMDELKCLLHVNFDNVHSQWWLVDSVNSPKIQDPLLSEHPNVFWRVFNEFVMLGTDASFVGQDDPSAKNEWLELLGGLAASKKRLALDGMVVSLHVDQLADEASLTLFADKIRSAYEDVRQVCGVEVPISVVIQGLEELPGVDAWSNGLERELKRKIIGKLNSHGETASKIVDECVDGLRAILNQGALKYLMESGYSPVVAEVSSLVDGIRNGLDGLLGRALSGSQFQRPPVFAGLFFVAHKGGDWWFVDDLLESNALLGGGAKTTDTVTVADKNRRRNLAASYACGGVLIALLSMIHSYDADRIRASLEGYKNRMASDSDGLAETKNLVAQFRFISDLDDVSVAHWFFAGIDPLGNERRKRDFLKDVQASITEPMDIAFAERIADVDDDDDARIDYISILVRRINLLNAVLAGTSADDLRAMPAPYDQSYLDALPESELARLNELLINSFEIGRTDQSGRYPGIWRQQRRQYQETVTELLGNSYNSMGWLVDWTNRSGMANDVVLSDYWGGSIEQRPEAIVQRAYTLAGKQMIDDFIDQITGALGADHVFLKQFIPKFRTEYEQNYFASWGAFMAGFGEGAELLSQRSDWLRVLNNIPTGKNIFFKMLNDADEQLAPFAGSAQAPDWYEFVVYYQDMLALGDDELQGNPKKNKVLTKLALKVVGATGSVGKAVAKSAKSGLKTQKKLDKAEGAGPGPSERELNLQQAATELDAYKKVLAELIFNIERRGASYTNVRGVFENQDNPAAAGTALANVQLSIRKLQALIGNSRIATQPFWEIYQGPLLLAEQFLLREAACHVDNQWRDNYLFELVGVPDYKLGEVAYADGGLLWQFIDAELSPFLKKRQNSGYSVRRMGDQYLGVNGEFLNYVARAQDDSKRQKFATFDLDITAMPTSVNKNALLFVSQTELTLACDGTSQSLINNNYMVEERFVWEPSCGPTSLRFTVGNKVVEKLYAGRDGLRSFLADFSDGEHSYDIEEFPNLFYLLKQFEIRRIRVKLDIEGGNRLLAALSQAPVKAPKTIAMCWN